MKVIGLIMTYNCENFIEEAYKKIPKKYFSDLILVDDGSTDGTVKIAKKLNIKTYVHDHKGYGGNIKYGLQKAFAMGADIVVEIHGDGQYDLASVPSALKKIKEGYNFVLGSRFTNYQQALQDNMSYARYLANVGLSFFDRIILQLPLTEFHTGFRVYTKKLMKTTGYDHTSNDYLYSFEIIAQAKFHNLKITEVPVRCYYGAAHTSVSIKKAALYSFQTFGTLWLYCLAKFGWENNLFHKS